MQTTNSKLTRSVAALLATGIVLALGSASASAATFAPAGDAFRLTSSAVTFTSPAFGRSITCSNSTLSGTLASPASGTASIPPSGIAFNNGGSTPCTFKLYGTPVGTATITPQGVVQSSLVASSTTQVNLGLPSGSLRITIRPNGSIVTCNEFVSPSTVSQAGSWSNVTSALSFAGAGTVTVTTSDGGFCSNGTYTLTAAYAASNLTHPGTPITVQP